MAMTNEQKRLVEDNMNLVYFTISKYYPTFVNNEDVIQSGMLGLCKAATTYDASKTKFATYGAMCIRNEIRLWLRSRQKWVNDLSLSTTMTDEEGSDSFEERIPAETEEVGNDFADFINKLPDRDKLICNLRLEGGTLDEIGDQLGVSHQWIHQKMRKIKKKWDKHCREEG